jgi:hypothetical protein
MIHDRRGAGAPWLLALTLVLAACGGSGGEVRSCSTDTDCGPGALCVRSACVANRPPVVSLQLPPSPTTHRVLFVDALAVDPDAGDSITRHAWSVTSLGAGCEAEPEPTSGARLELVFWCAGSYEVSVVAEDARGGVSLPARQVVEVAAASAAPVVTPAAPSAFDHLCGGSPFACRPALAGGAVALPLSAVVDDPSGGALAYRWRMIPPSGAGPSATVTWSHGSGSLATEAWVETADGTIAGTWRFRLRATSAAGLVGQGEQVVQVENRLPLLAVAPLRLDHRYLGGAYLASGSLAVPAADPDGDPLVLSAILVESGTGGCSSRLGAVVGGAVTFEVSCTDPAGLIGAATRTIRVSATDAGGGSVTADVPVEIGNRAPVLRLASNPAGGSIALDHSVGPCLGTPGSCFAVAGSAAFEAVDPDGDPVGSPAVAAAVDPARTTSSGQVTTAGGVASFRFTTPIARPGEFRGLDGSTGFSLVATAADPFGASGRADVPVVALNRSPVVKLALPAAVVAHQYDPTLGLYVATSPLATFEDPDGDPLRVDGSVGDATCAAFSISGGAARVTCQRAYSPASGLPPLAAFVGDHRVVGSASDAWEQVGSPTTVNIQDGAPSAIAFSGAVESCYCPCPKWSADGSTCLGQGHWTTDSTVVPLPVTATDADGDPVQVTYSGAAINGGAQKTVLPTGCGATLNRPSLPVTVAVTIDDGLARASTTSTVTGLFCSRAGLACTP